MTTLKTYLPYFPGFYASQLSDLIDREEEMRQENGDDTPVDFKAASLAISRVWVEAFNDEFGTSFEFSGLWSPREYNFTTDKCEVTLSPSDVEKLHAYHGSAEMGRVIARECKNRDGFASFYSDDPTDEEWTRPLEEYEEAQLSLLIMAMVEAEGEPERLAYHLLCGHLDYKFSEAASNA